MHTLWREWYRLPGLLRIGLLVFAAGSGLDLAFHAGMAPIVLGLIAEGV